MKTFNEIIKRSGVRFFSNRQILPYYLNETLIKLFLQKNKIMMHELFKNTYYFIALLFAIYELGYIINLKESIQTSKERTEGLKKYKDKNEWSEELKKSVNSNLFVCFFIILPFMFGGLFTFQWVLIGLYIIFELLMSGIFKIFKQSFLYSTFVSFNSLIGFFFAIFIIMNEYHLHIDVSQLIINYITK